MNIPNTQILLKSAIPKNGTKCVNCLCRHREQVILKTQRQCTAIIVTIYGSQNSLLRSLFEVLSQQGQCFQLTSEIQNVISISHMITKNACKQ